MKRGLVERKCSVVPRLSLGIGWNFLQRLNFCNLLLPSRNRLLLKLVEWFQIIKDDAVKVLQSICQKFGNSAVATGLETVSFHSNPKERQCQRMFKLPHNCTHLTG